MKNSIILLLLMFACTPAKSQHSGKVGWYITGEYSPMFLDNHIGNAVGFSVGVTLLREHLKIGFFNYGRSGPINPQVFRTALPEGISYKGSTSLDLRADHGAFGLMIAPSFVLPNSRIEIDIPVYIGSFGAGFYLAGDDRITPDNRRVSEWEDELFEGQDANFAGMVELGLRILIPSKMNPLKYGLGLHYTTTQDWTAFADPSGDFYNNKFRASFFIQFGSDQRNNGK